MTTRTYTAWIHREDDGWVALCPELDVASQGQSIEEAKDNLREAVELFLETAPPEENPEPSYDETYITPLEVRVG